MVQTADDVVHAAAFRDFGYLDTFNAMGGIGACPEQQARTPDDGYYWPERIASIREKLAPEVVVIQLGTNDRFHADCVADYGAQAIDPIMQALPGVPVLWLDVREDLGPEATAINEQLHAATARWPNLEILPYSAHFSNHPGWEDGVHLTDKGQAEYARWLIAALDERVPEPSTTTTVPTSTSSG
jgi:lysophospholipase L1-like esterase